MSESISNQYLIAIQLKDFDKLKSLTTELRRIQSISKAGAKFALKIDPGALNTIETQVAAAVAAGITGGVGTKAPGGVHGTGGHGQSTSDGLNGATLRSLEVSIGALNSTLHSMGSMKMDFGTQHIEDSFRNITNRMVEKLMGAFKHIPDILDFDTLMEKSTAHKAARAAGRTRPFQDPAEAINVLRSKFSQPAEKEYAQTYVRDLIRRNEAATLNMRQEEQRRRERQERIAQQFKDGPQERIDRRTMASSRLVGIRPNEIGLGDEDLRQVFHRRLNEMRRERDAMIATIKQDDKGGLTASQKAARVKSLEANLGEMEAFSRNTSYQGFVPFEGSIATQAARKAKTAQRVASFYAKQPTATLDEFLRDIEDQKKNPIVGALIGSPKSLDEIPKIVARLKAASPALQAHADYFNLYKPASIGNAPRYNPIDALQDDAMFADMRRKERRGWRYRMYDDTQLQSLQGAATIMQGRLSGAKDDEERTAVQRRINQFTSLYEMGGEWFNIGKRGTRGFPGFQMLQKATGDLDLSSVGMNQEHLGNLRTVLEHMGKNTGLGGQLGAAGLTIPAVMHAQPGSLKEIAEFVKSIGGTDVNAATQSISALIGKIGELDNNLRKMGGQKRALFNRQQIEAAKDAGIERKMLDRRDNTDAKVEVLEEKDANNRRMIRRRMSEAAARGDIAAAMEDARLLRQTQANDAKEKLVRLRAELGRNGMGGEGDRIATALAMQGVGSRRFLPPEVVKEYLRRSVHGLAAEQETGQSLFTQMGVMQTLGINTTGHEKAFMMSNVRQDQKMTDFMLMLRRAGEVLPGHFGKYSDNVDQWAAMASQRATLEDAHSRVERYHRMQADPSVTGDRLSAAYQDYIAANQTLRGFGHSFAGGSGMGAAEAQKQALNKVIPDVNARRAAEDAVSAATLNGVQVDVQRTTGLGKMDTALGFVIDKLKAMSVYLVLGAAMYGFVSELKNAVTAVTDLESAMASIQGVLSGKSLSERLEIKKGVIDAAIEYGVSIKEAASVAKIFAQTGIGGSNTVLQTRAAMAGVTGLGLNPSQASEMLIATTQLSKGLVTGAEIVDRISVVEGKYAVTAQDLSDAIQRVGAVATQFQPKRLGGTDAFDTVMGATTSIVEGTRVSGNQAATALRFMIARLASPDVGKHLQNSFGINLATSAGGHELRPLSDIIGDIAEKYKALKQPDASGQSRTVEAAQLLATFAGARQMNAAAALLDNWDKSLRVASESALAFGEAQHRVAIQLDTWDGQMSVMRASLGKFMDALLTRTGLLALGTGALKGQSSLFRDGVNDPAGTVFSTASKFSMLTAVPAIIQGSLSLLSKIGEKGERAGTIGRLGSAVWNAEKAANDTMVVGSIVRNIGVLGRFAGTLSLWGVAIAGIAGVVLGLMQKANAIKAAADLLQSKWGVDPIDPLKIAATPQFTEYRNQANKYGMGPATLAAAVQAANDVASKAVLAKFGAGLLTTDDKARTYDSRSGAVYEKALTVAMMQQVPDAFRGVTSEADRTNIALNLLKGTLVQVGGVSSEVQAQLMSKLQANSDELQGNFSLAAANGKRIFRASDLPKGVPVGDPYAFSKALVGGGSLHYLGGGNPLAQGNLQYMTDEYTKAYGAAKVTDLNGPGFAYTDAVATLSRGRQATAQDRLSDYRTLLNNMGSGVGDQYAMLGVRGANGKSEHFLEALDKMVVSGKTLGEAFDDLSKAAYQLKDGMTPSDKARVDANRADFQQSEYDRLARNLKLPAWAQAKLGVGAAGVGGGTAAQIRQQLTEAAFEQIKAKLAESNDPRMAPIIAGLKLSEASKNRPQGKADLGANGGIGYARDRVLESMIRYGTQYDENIGMAHAMRGGVGGFDLASAQRSNALTLLQSVTGAVAQTKGDLIRVMSQIMMRREMGKDTEGRGASMIDEAQLDQGRNLLSPEEMTARNEALADEADPTSMKSLKAKRDFLRKAVATLKGDKALFDNIDAGDKHDLLELMGIKVTDKNVDQVFLRYLSTISRIKQVAVERFTAENKAVYARDTEMEQAKHLLELERERLRTNHQMSELLRQQAIHYTEITDTPGAEYTAQLDAISKRQAEAEMEARTDAANRRADLQDQSKHHLLLQGQPELEYKQGAIDRELEANLQRIRGGASHERQQFVGDRSNSLTAMAERDGDDLLKRSTAGLREAFAQGAAGFRGTIGELVERVLKPFTDTLQQRFADNFMDAVLGSNGLFRDQLSNVFQTGALQQYDYLIRAFNEGSDVAAEKISKAVAGDSGSVGSALSITGARGGRGHGVAAVAAAAAHAGTTAALSAAGLSAGSNVLGTVTAGPITPVGSLLDPSILAARARLGLLTPAERVEAKRQGLSGLLEPANAAARARLGLLAPGTAAGLTGLLDPANANARARLGLLASGAAPSVLPAHVAAAITDLMGPQMDAASANLETITKAGLRAVPQGTIAVHPALTGLLDPADAAARARLGLLAPGASPKVLPSHVVTAITDLMGPQMDAASASLETITKAGLRPVPRPTGGAHLLDAVRVDAAASRHPEKGNTAALFAAGEALVGTPFEMGGVDKRVALDCAAFIRSVFGSIGINLNESAAGLAKVGRPVKSLKDMRPGDIMVLDAEHDDGVGDHAMIYAGSNKVMHSSSSGHGVRFDGGYYYKKALTQLIAIRRVTPENSYGTDRSYFIAPTALNSGVKPGLGHYFERDPATDSFMNANEPDGPSRYGHVADMDTVTKPRVKTAMKGRPHLTPEELAWAQLHDLMNTDTSKTLLRLIGKPKQVGVLNDTSQKLLGASGFYNPISQSVLLTPDALSNVVKRQRTFDHEMGHRLGFTHPELFDSWKAARGERTSSDPTAYYNVNKYEAFAESFRTAFEELNDSPPKTKASFEANLSADEAKAPGTIEIMRWLSKQKDYQNAPGIKALTSMGIDLNDIEKVERQYYKPVTPRFQSLRARLQSMLPYVDQADLPTGVGEDLPRRITDEDRLNSPLTAGMSEATLAWFAKHGTSDNPITEEDQKQLQKVKERQLMIKNAMLSGGQLLGSGLGAQLNRPGGLLGMRLGVNGGANFAQEGSSMGAAFGPALMAQWFPALGSFAGPLGAVALGVVGGLLGGLFKKKQQVTPEYVQLEKIAANTRESVTAIQNQNRDLLSIENRLLNVPASFVLPQYRPLTGSGSSGDAAPTFAEGAIQITVTESNNPRQTAAMLAEELNRQLRGAGSYSTPKL